MTNNTYSFNIINYFSSMDIEKLRLKLNDNYPYQDTTKEIFLNEIEKIFIDFKKLGDTKLLQYEGACIAKKTCDNCGKKGFRFVGDNSKNYIDFIFEIEGEDIKDIYDCSQFETEETLSDLQRQGFIHINLDDEIKFIKTNEYWNKVNSAITAYEEIISVPPKQLDFEELCYWIEKHADLNNIVGSYDIFNPIMKWTPFSIIYSDLREFKSYISLNLDKFIQAISSLEQITNEKNLIDWLMDYEVTYNKLPFDLKYSFKRSENIYILEKSNPFILAGEKFIKTFSFIESYQKHNDEMLNKYDTYTKEEEAEACNDNDSYKKGVDVFSLKFHIQKRKSLEEIGINIPFYINNQGNQSDYEILFYL